MRQLKYHEKKLLKKVDFLHWKSTDNVRELQVLRRYHIQDRDDYKKYNKLCGHVTKLVAVLKKLGAQDETRIELTDQLLDKLYNMGVISTKKSLVQVERLSVASFCRRRLAVVMVRLKMAENLRQACTYIEQGHVRVGPDAVTDPAFHVSRSDEDFVTWVDTSRIKRKVLAYNDKLDDFDLVVAMDTKDFFSEYGEANRYTIKEVIGKGSYGVVCSAVDNYTGEKVAIKKINNVFDHVSDATRILREIKLLRLLRHPDIVEIKHIMLPPTPREFKDIYVVFELMETDLHQVIKANDDLTPEHHQFFLYQMLRGLKYIHSARVFHRDLKPKNILANSDCKLKVCDFGLARPSFNDMPQTVFWTDYVATRWYRAPELCGSFFAKYSSAIDIWSIGCIFAEILQGKPLFPGRNVVHQLELITDLLGSPSAEVIAKVRNEKARRFLMNMRKKPGIPLEQYFPKADKGALKLLKRLLAFDPAERPTAEEALADPYFLGLAQPSREPTREAVSKLAFEFERRKLAVEEVRELIYREILEYHPQVLADFLAGPRAQPNFYYPSAIDKFKRQFAELESGSAGGGGGAGRPNGLGQATSLPRERMREFQHEASKYAPPGSKMLPGSGVPGAAPGLPIGAAAHPAAAAVHELGHGVRNMTVMEHGGAVPGAAGHHHHHVARPYASQFGGDYASNALLRSNSYQ